MIPLVSLTTALAGAGAALLAVALLLAGIRRWRRKSPAEIERLRRLDVNHRGRITLGQIVDLIEPELSKSGPRLVVYKYEISGATYEASQDLSALPGVVCLARRVAGQTAGVKYDPKRPANSIIACEEWSGVPEAESRETAGPRTTRTRGEVVEKS